MSHYTILVIGENPEEHLEPFWELDLSKEDLADDCRAEFQEEFSVEDLEKEFLEFKEEHKKEIEEAKTDYMVKYKTCSAEEWVEDWNGKYLNKEKTHYGYYINLHSKWDWYVIGGRWAGSLKLKKDVDKSKYDNPNFSWGWDEKSKKEVLENSSVDQAIRGDIDFSRDEKVYNKSLRFWEIVIEDSELKNGEEKPFSMYKKEYYLEKYKTKEKYAELQSEFGTFAVLKDGEWFEKGEMGWFGCSSENPEEARKWDESFYETFIKDLPDNTLLTIIDCHI